MADMYDEFYLRPRKWEHTPSLDEFLRAQVHRNLETRFKEISQFEDDIANGRVDPYDELKYVRGPGAKLLKELHYLV
jgi:hypothetical protein